MKCVKTGAQQKCKTYVGERTASPTNGDGKTEFTCRKLKLDAYFPKVDLQCITHLNIRPQTLKQLEKNRKILPRY